MTTLTFSSQSGSSFVPCAKELIERFCGVRLTLAKPGDSAAPVDVYHGDDESFPCALRIPFVEAYDESNVPDLPEEPDREILKNARARFPFDLFAALRFWLADEGNADGERNGLLDEHQRLIADRSLQHRKGVLETPIVNAYLVLFRHFLETRFEIEAWQNMPRGKRCVITLSHDVDDPLDPTFRKDLWLAAGAFPRAPCHAAARLARATARHAVRSFRARTRQKKKNRHWLFPEVMDAERRLGFRSTFFFSTVPFFTRGADSRDVDYDIRHPRFRELFDVINHEGWEIGLHISYNARESCDRIASEVGAIDRVAGVPVLGSRHHYWHMSQPFWQTLSDHARANLGYDSSIAFNERPGYRLGIAFPCYLWNPLSGQRIGTMQIPCLIMDGAFFYHPNQTVDAVLEHTERLLEQLKRFRGVAAIDWHVRTSYPGSDAYRSWGEAYLKILEMLAADSEVLVQSCRETLEMFSAGHGEGFAANRS